jgi:hypothetical protein
MIRRIRRSFKADRFEWFDGAIETYNFMGVPLFYVKGEL